MGLSFQPTFPRCPSLTVEFAPLQGSGQGLRIESSIEPTQIRFLGPAAGV
jgi:hypothetical protein